MDQEKIKSFAKEFDISEKLAEEIFTACEDNKLNETVIKGKISELAAEHQRKREEENLDEGLTPYIRRKFFEYIDEIEEEEFEESVSSSYYEKISQKIDNWGNDLLTKFEKRGNGNIFNIFLPASIILFILVILLLFLTDGFRSDSVPAITAVEEEQTEVMTESQIDCYRKIFDLTSDMEPKNVFLSSAIIQKEGACDAYKIIDELFSKDIEDNDN
ncbi:MAG: hypothetical protein FXF49_12160 [Flexistipes sinusarabici]|uniref:Uncharacterized protein n=1 Tax=Flexistipes sinusarabici TaxID=2352 RepID=A0A5D0MK76_FLESI|nr:hypothetical protein [Flexistipes sinusarabici]TYB32315.1 MAG: hypothetical protein FXF49_12160 [Flexistipes sinusarabici]